MSLDFNLLTHDVWMSGSGGDINFLARNRWPRGPTQKYLVKFQIYL